MNSVSMPVVPPSCEDERPESENQECIVILAPFGQDAVLLAGVLWSVARPLCVSDMETFCNQLSRCAVGVLTTEALTSQGVQQLARMLSAQPVWSDLPLVILSNRIESASYSLLAESLNNVTIIERPLDASSLLTLARTALRARQKQYQVRDLLVEAERQHKEINALNARLQRAMTETHHRVKNSLQLISAFVDMQAQEHEVSVPVIELKRIHGQVRALAAVHDILTHETKHSYTADFVSAKRILEKLFPMLGSMIETKRLRYTLEEVRLPSRQGTSLALIANELILNALKHSSTEVVITLHVQGAAAVLIVCDDGTGLPAGFDVKQASQTGLALVENLARWDLRGETTYTNRAGHHGAQIQITFPLSSAEDEALPGGNAE